MSSPEYTSGETVIDQCGGQWGLIALAAKRAGVDVSLFAGLHPGNGSAIRSIFAKEEIDVRTIQILSPENFVPERADQRFSELLCEGVKTIAESRFMAVHMEISDKQLQQAIGIARRVDVDVIMKFTPRRRTMLRLSNHCLLTELAPIGNIRSTHEIHTLVVDDDEAAFLTGTITDNLPSSVEATQILAEDGGYKQIVMVNNKGRYITWKRGIMWSPIPYVPISLSAPDTIQCHPTYRNWNSGKDRDADAVFYGALLACLAENASMEYSICFAEQAGNIYTSKANGSQRTLSDIPKREAIEEIVNRLYPKQVLK